MIEETDEVIAGECDRCGHFMVMTKVHGDLGEYPPAVIDMTAKYRSGLPMSYNGPDRPDFHAPHEYLHVRE